MRHYLYSLLLATIVLIPFNTWSQSLASKNKEELLKINEKAIASENYDLAIEIKNELNKRKTIDEKIDHLNLDLKTALAAEDYGKAEELKKAITQLKRNKEKIELLKREKQAAISAENFDGAIEIDKKIAALKNPLPKNDRPLSAAGEIDYLINHYDKELDAFENDGKYTVFKGEQRTQMMSIFSAAQEVYVKLRARVEYLTAEEIKGVHLGFLPLLKVSQDELTISKYRNYYLENTTKKTSYTLADKIKIQIDFYQQALDKHPKESENYDATIDAFKTQIKNNNDYLNRVNSLKPFEVNIINMVFPIAAISLDIPLDRETIIDYFPYPN